MSGRDLYFGEFRYKIGNGYGQKMYAGITLDRELIKYTQHAVRTVYQIGKEAEVWKKIEMELSLSKRQRLIKGDVVNLSHLGKTMSHDDNN